MPLFDSTVEDGDRKRMGQRDSGGSGNYPGRTQTGVPEGRHASPNVGGLAHCDTAPPGRGLLTC